MTTASGSHYRAVVSDEAAATTPAPPHPAHLVPELCGLRRPPYAFPSDRGVRVIAKTTKAPVQSSGQRPAQSLNANLVAGWRQCGGHHAALTVDPLS